MHDGAGAWVGVVGAWVVVVVVVGRTEVVVVVDGRTVVVVVGVEARVEVAEEEAVEEGDEPRERYQLSLLVSPRHSAAVTPFHPLALIWSK